MALNETNSLQSQFNFGRSTFVRYSPGEEFISLAKVIEECGKNSIEVIQLTDKRLESGLNLLPLKVKSSHSNDVLILFLTKYNEKTIIVTAYYNGKRIDKASVNNQEQISKVIKKWVEAKKSAKQDFQGRSLKIIEKLDTKSNQIAKQQKSEMVAIQKLKSTAEYQALIQLQIQLNMEIDSLSQALAEQQKIVEESNDQLLDRVLIIEALKAQIEYDQFEYEDVCKNLRNVKEMIKNMMEKQQQKVEEMQITNQTQLAEFLVEAKKLKKLQLQKRFLH